MVDDSVAAYAVLAAWVRERVTTGTLLSLPDDYYIPSSGVLWLEVTRVGLIFRVDERVLVEVVGWDARHRARGREVSRRVWLRLDVLEIPGVLTHPEPR